ncbi:unnamed protein product [Trifolium pratense]|uniref:Uncharacterized protein n=1 Tax=Trifolium pratense TaxID=57577 RepID=A0ACB0KF82_TRIPR|nr:unnamed protein product [Trifolium pratense]
MVSCLDFLISLIFGTMVKRFVSRTDKHNSELEPAKSPSIIIVERDRPRRHNY